MNMERKTGLMNKKYVSPCFLPGMRLGNIMFTLAAACAHARTVGVECRVSWAYNDASLMLRSRLGGWVLPSTPCGTNEPPSWQEPSFSYCPVPSRIRTGGLRGYFQSARYFEGQEAFIRALFAPLTAEKEPGAVGIHIRLGDYRRLRDKHRILDPGFLRRAAGHLSSGKNRLVLFSDEPDEAAEMLARVPAFRTLCAGNRPRRSVRIPPPHDGDGGTRHVVFFLFLVGRVAGKYPEGHRSARLVCRRCGRLPGYLPAPLGNTVIPPRTHTRKTMNTRTVTSLWVGGELPLMSVLCIKSFLDHGHTFQLFTYRNYDNIPAGTLVRDARDILPEEAIFHDSHNSLAPFSDWFRMKFAFTGRRLLGGYGRHLPG